MPWRLKRRGVPSRLALSAPWDARAHTMPKRRQRRACPGAARATSPRWDAPTQCPGAASAVRGLAPRALSHPGTRGRTMPKRRKRRACPGAARAKCPLGRAPRQCPGAASAARALAPRALSAPWDARAHTMPWRHALQGPKPCSGLENAWNCRRPAQSPSRCHVWTHCPAHVTTVGGIYSPHPHCHPAPRISMLMSGRASRNDFVMSLGSALNLEIRGVRGVRASP